MEERLVGINFTEWKEGAIAPRSLVRSMTDAAVGANEVVYLRHGGTKEIYAYDAGRDSWTRLLDCPNVGCSLTLVAGEKLTTIGGFDDKRGYSSKLFSFAAEEGRYHDTKKWTESFHPMPTKRYGTTALSTRTTLIVLGGWGEGGPLNTVEVMNIETHQWFSAACLLSAALGSSGAICGNHIYLHGGEVGKGQTKHLYMCSLDDLMESCEPNETTAADHDQQDGICVPEPQIKFLMKSNKEHTEERHETKSKHKETLDSLWYRNPCDDLPTQISTLVSVNEQLLAVGGYADFGITTSAIHHHSTTSVYIWSTVEGPLPYAISSVLLFCSCGLE